MKKAQQNAKHIRASDFFRLTCDADAPPEVEVLEVGRAPGDDLQAGVGDPRAVGEAEVLQGKQRAPLFPQGRRGGGEDGAHGCATCRRERGKGRNHHSCCLQVRLREPCFR